MLQQVILVTNSLQQQQQQQQQQQHEMARAVQEPGLQGRETLQQAEDAVHEETLERVEGAGAKRCTLCGVLKPDYDYYKDKRTHDGLRTRCKACVKNPQVRETWTLEFLCPLFIVSASSYYGATIGKAVLSGTTLKSLVLTNLSFTRS